MASTTARASSAALQASPLSSYLNSAGLGAALYARGQELGDAPIMLTAFIFVPVLYSGCGREGGRPAARASSAALQVFFLFFSRDGRYCVVKMCRGEGSNPQPRPPRARYPSFHFQCEHPPTKPQTATMSKAKAQSSARSAAGVREKPPPLLGQFASDKRPRWPSMSI